MSKIGMWGRGAEEARKRKEAREERERALARERLVYDQPASEERKKELMAALAVEHGTPWLAAVVDVGRQLQAQQLEVIAALPGGKEATEAGVRYAELRRLEGVLLGMVEKAREGVKGLRG